MFVINIDSFYRKNEKSLSAAGFRRNSFYCYRKHGNSFQCITVGRGRSDIFNHELFLIVFPFWTKGIKRIKSWPSFEEAFLHPELFNHTTLAWPVFGIEITESYRDFFEKFTLCGDSNTSYFTDELIPFLNNIYDNQSFINAMSCINRHCRVFEELILLESLKGGDLKLAKNWLELAEQRDSMSIKAVAESVYSPKDETEIDYYKAWGLNSFDDAIEDAKKAVKRTHDMFYNKLLHAIQANDYKWVKASYQEEQRKAVLFFKNHFDIEFEIESL